MATERIATNGIELQTTVEGEGPPIVLLHGFPELAYSWRGQIPALVEAGYRVIAPDLRGFGGSSAPEDPSEYDQVTLAADVMGLLDALGEDTAIVVGHDWGSNLAWSTALVEPERVTAVVGMSVPAIPRAPAPPIDLLRQGVGEDFYMVWFQTPDAEKALSADVRRTFTAREVWSRKWAEAEDREPLPPPDWMGEEHLQVYVDAYERTGFRGGLNWYRAMDHTWEATAPYADRKIEQPALFITGSLDPVATFAPAAVMQGYVTDLRDSVVIEGGGHWINQERPDEVNAALLGFLRSL